MINLIIWFAAFFCPNPNHTIQHHGNCKMIHITTNSSSDNDIGGETGGTPPPTVPPPPPPVH
ncbi:MAG: hypothetical protein WDM90_11670 [Ferruginibacter sp.]